MRVIFRSSVAALALGLCPGVDAADVRWDKWDVPHIEGGDQADTMRAFGWSQMEAQGDLILDLYARARGTSTEVNGDETLAADILTHQLDLPARAQHWYAKLPAEDRKQLKAFVAGMNAYAREHPVRFSPEKRGLLPIRETDPLAHIYQVIHRFFIADGTIRAIRKEAGAMTAPVAAPDAVNGSNGYAVAPSRSADGNAMLLVNPHLPWSDHFTWFEAHLKYPGSNAYGVALVGMPFLGIAFSEQGGWTHTVNFFDGADAYRLTLDGDRYRFGNEWKSLEKRQVTLRVRKPDGGFRKEELTLSSSVQGPIVERADDQAFALRIAGFDSFGMLRQYWDMAAARNVAEFEAATSRLQIPYYNTIYASRDGDIYYLYGGRFPKRSVGDHKFWGGIVPGDRPEFLWSDYLDYSEIPHFRNPPGGFIQNANDPPWLTTIPHILEPRAFAPDIVIDYDMDWRAQHSLQQILDKPVVGYDDLAGMQQQNRLGFADRILDDLLAAAEGCDDPVVREAVDVLSRWDHTSASDSKGAILFIEWGNRMGMDQPDRLFSTQWNRARWNSTPDGLADPTLATDRLREAAVAVKERYGRLDIAYGDAVRIRRGNTDIAAPGVPTHFGSFHAAWFLPDTDGKNRVIGGDSFIATVSFGPRLKANGLLPHGNGGPLAEVGDEQLELFAQGRMRDVFYYDEEIAAATTRREVLE